MPRAIVRPTQAELDVLRVIWERGPSTVRQVLGALAATRPVGYTTILKTMQIMAEKGLVTRDESQRTHIYAARYTQHKTQAQLVRDLLERAFGGSAPALVMQTLAAGKVSSEEVQAIRRLLDQLEGERK